MVLPTVGQLMVEMAMYRFASNLALLLKSGVPLMETMRTVKGILQEQPDLRDALEHALPQGSRLAGRCTRLLQETGLFLPMLISMVQVGEESGQLAWGHGGDRTLFPGRVKGRGSSLKVTKMLEPLIIMVMGVTIAGVMLAIYMPMFEMAGKVK